MKRAEDQQGMDWGSGRLIQHDSGSPAWNMAVDESLLQQIDSPVLRFYKWAVPALSIGYFQSWVIVPSDRPFVRRYTGGGLVDHAHDFTYTVVASRDSFLGKLSTAESYALIHQGIVRALTELNVPAELTAECSESQAAGCFQKPVKSDIMLGEMKIAGAAQRRTRRGMMQQGSILLPDPHFYPLLQRLLPKILGAEFGFKWTDSELTPQEIALATELEASRYCSPDWNQER